MPNSHAIVSTKTELLIRNKYVTVGWFYLPAILTLQQDWFGFGVLSVGILFTMFCIGCLFKEYPWKKAQPTEIPAFDAKPLPGSELRTVVSKHVMWGNMLQVYSMLGIILHTLISIVIHFVTSTGWEYLVTAFISILLVLCVGFLILLSSMGLTILTLIPRTKILSSNTSNNK